MRTEAVIDELVRELRPRWSLTPVYAAGLLAGTVLAAVTFFVLLGVRADIDQALSTVRFPFKFVATTTLAVPALGLLLPLSRPGAALGPWPAVLLLAPVLLILAGLAELVAMPVATWGLRLVGSNALVCLLAIPVLALGPLACLMACLRYGAPTRPGLTGAVAGLAASGIAATFYAAHCPDDSPLFVGTWYVLATAVVCLTGFLVGRRLLTW